MKSIKQKIKYIIVKILSLVSIKSIKYDMVILKLDALGDFVIWLGSAKYLCKQNYNNKKCLVCKKTNIDLAKKCKYFDDIIVVDNYRDCLKKLRKVKAKLLIDPTYSRSSLDYFCALSIKADNKIAIDGDTVNICTWEKKYDSIFNKLVKTPKKNMPEIMRYNYFIRKLIGVDVPAELSDLSFIESTNKFGNYFVINLGANAGFRRWSVENFVKVASYIYEITNLMCVLIGAKNEVDLAEKFDRLYRFPLNIQTGKTSIIEMIEIISNASLIVTNDTSTVHIGVAAGVKTFAIAPGYYYPRFTAYPRNICSTPPVFFSKSDMCKGCLLNGSMHSECIDRMQKDKVLECVSLVKPDEVIDEIKRHYSESAVVKTT